MTRIPNTRLKLLVEETGWSGSQLGAAVRAVAAENGQPLRCDRSLVSRWISGTRPRPPAAGFLLEALSRKLGRPIPAAEAGLSRVPTPLPEMSWESDPVYELSVLTRADLDPSRRYTLNTNPYSIAALKAPDPERLIRHTPPTTAVRRAGQAEDEQLQAMARVFAEATNLHGGGYMRTALAAYLNHDVASYLHASASEGIHRRLLSDAAQLTLLLGIMCAGDGADALAQHYHQTAARLAVNADDTAIFAVALRAMSTHAHDLGHRTPAAVHLAERAVTVAQSAPPLVQAYAQAQLAVAQSHDSRRAALTALTTAERLYAQSDFTPGPFTNYSLGALHYQRAETFAILGDRPGAISALTASLRLRTPGERHARALTQARLAETLFRLGHREAALTHWQAYLDVYPTLRSTRAARRLNGMRRILYPHRRETAARTLLSRAAPL
ncbi:tol-pal system YbgF family protein [Streptomyces sp. NPDC050658]|uniref:tetratricopeptide repeat protein n=1 Tax=unclassified Streptomyces TaxID=2593676 RepID=UPI003423B8C5